MNFQQGFALLTLLGTITSTSGYIESSLHAKHDKPRTYCGRVLATALALLCYDDDKLADMIYKRSGNENMYNNLIPGYYNGEPQLQEAAYGWPWISALKARTLNSGSRYKRQYVVSECCEKACTVQELISYCPRD